MGRALGGLVATVTLQFCPPVLFRSLGIPIFHMDSGKARHPQQRLQRTPFPGLLSLSP